MSTTSIACQRALMQMDQLHELRGSSYQPKRVTGPQVSGPKTLKVILSDFRGGRLLTTGAIGRAMARIHWPPNSVEQGIHRVRRLELLADVFVQFPLESDVIRRHHPARHGAPRRKRTSCYMFCGFCRRCCGVSSRRVLLALLQPLDAASSTLGLRPNRIDHLCLCFSLLAMQSTSVCQTKKIVRTIRPYWSWTNSAGTRPPRYVRADWDFACGPNVWWSKSSFGIQKNGSRRGSSSRRRSRPLFRP